MNKHTLLILVLAVTLLSCDSEEKNNNILKGLIDKSLSSGKSVKSAFLNLRFGMSKIDFETELNKIKQTGKIKPDYSGYSYEFVNNKSLEGIHWIITSRTHNDSIIGIHLHSYKNFWKNNFNTLDETYREVIKEYIAAYGQPTYIKNEFENYWLKDNLLIEITKSKDDDLGGSVHIRYDDKRKESSIKLTKCRFDAYGNTLDPWYYDLKEETKPQNKDI